MPPGDGSSDPTPYHLASVLRVRCGGTAGDDGEHAGEVTGKGKQMSGMTYDVSYFLAKFEAIPEGESPMAGTSKQEWYELDLLIRSSGLRLMWILSGIEEGYPQPTPKQRILAALRDVKKGAE